MIDGHKPDDNVDLAESRDVNCVSKIDDNAGGHYNGDTTTVHVVMVMSKILMMLIKAIIISSTLVMMETAIIMMLMSVMTKMMVTTIATKTIEWLGQGNEGTLPCSPPPPSNFLLSRQILYGHNARNIFVCAGARTIQAMMITMMVVTVTLKIVISTIMKMITERYYDYYT